MTDAECRRANLLLLRVIALVGASVVLEIIVQLLPPHYSAIRDTESALAVGRYGAIEAVSFCLRGGLVFMLIKAAGLVLPRSMGSPVGGLLLSYAAAAKFVIAFATTDLTPRPETIHGTVHAIFAFTSFFAASIGEVLVARKLLSEPSLPGRLLYRLGWITVGWSVVIAATVGANLGVWGVLERIETVLLLGWIVIFAAALRQRTLLPVVAWSAT